MGKSRSYIKDNLGKDLAGEIINLLSNNDDEGRVGNRGNL